MGRKPNEDPSTVYTRKVCQEWAKNPLYNPLATKKHRLQPSETGVYGKLKKNCKKLHNISARLTEQEQVPTHHSVTPVDCEALRKNPTRNPLTGRAIDPTALHGVYQRLKKECKAIFQELSAPRAVPALPPKALEKLQRMRLRNALRRALQPILHSQDSLENRIHFAKVIRKYAEETEPCIQSSTDKKDKMVLVKPRKGSKPLERIYFDKQIGTKSAYGTAYMNAGKGVARLLRFSIKIMGDQFSNEVALLKKMSNLAEQKLSPNMPITYEVLHCKYPTTSKKLLKNADVPKLVQDGKYYVVLNELANGDLHDWFQYTYSPREYESVLMQLLFSLRTFHKYTNFVHNDSHLGNFLWHRVTPGGFWHYRYSPKALPTPIGLPNKPLPAYVDIYVPNTGYLLVLWDPGVARPIATNPISDYHPSRDYWRPLSLIQNIGRMQLYRDKNMKPIDPTIFLPFGQMVQLLGAYLQRDILMDYIADRKGKYLKHIYFDQLPANGVVLNGVPYEL